jgi:hypothetical protein
MVDWNIVFSTILGGTLTLAVTGGVSWWEFKRREKRQERNWYRRVHRLAVRSLTPRTTMFAMDDEDREVLAREYESNSEQLQELLADPYADTDPELYSAVQNLVFHLNQYVNRNPKERDDSARTLDNNDIQEYALITCFHIEERIAHDLDFNEPLEENFEQAREHYLEWISDSDEEEDEEE